MGLEPDDCLRCVQDILGIGIPLDLQNLDANLNMKPRCSDRRPLNSCSSIVDKAFLTAGGLWLRTASLA
jgi:hypothetical protein